MGGGEQSEIRPCTCKVEAIRQNHVMKSMRHGREMEVMRHEHVVKS